MDDRDRTATLISRMESHLPGVTWREDFRLDARPRSADFVRALNTLLYSAGAHNYERVKFTLNELLMDRAGKKGPGSREIVGIQRVDICAAIRKFKNDELALGNPSTAKLHDAGLKLDEYGLAEPIGGNDPHPLGARSPATP